VRVSPSSRRPTAIVTALLAAALLASLPIEAPAAATPTIEVLASTPEAVSLRFDADADSRAPLSVLVRVPDAGVIEAHIAPQTASGSITISEPAIMRDLRVVRVTFTPTEQAARAGADPRTVDVTLRGTGEPGLNEKRRHHSHVSPAFRGLYESQVVNYDASMERALTSADRTGASAAAPRSGRDPLPFGGRYLIIVWDAVEYLVEPLAEWKHRKGIQTRVVKLSDVGSTPEEIKDYIQTAYDTWAVPPEYVLLVGDTEQVPVYYGLTHTDNYYATVDGTDYLADIMVGRLTADGPGHCSTQVAKILGYERTPLENDPNWPASATLMIADDFDDGDWVYYMNTWLIYDLMDSAGFAPVDTLFRRNPVLIGDVYDSPCRHIRHVRDWRVRRRRLRLRGLGEGGLRDGSRGRRRLLRCEHDHRGEPRARAQARIRGRGVHGRRLRSGRTHARPGVPRGKAQALPERSEPTGVPGLEPPG